MPHATVLDAVDTDLLMKMRSGEVPLGITNSPVSNQALTDLQDALEHEDRQAITATLAGLDKPSMDKPDLTNSNEKVDALEYMKNVIRRFNGYHFITVSPNIPAGPGIDEKLEGMEDVVRGKGIVAVHRNPPVLVNGVVTSDGGARAIALVDYRLKEGNEKPDHIVMDRRGNVRVLEEVPLEAVVDETPKCPMCKQEPAVNGGVCHVCSATANIVAGSLLASGAVQASPASEAKK